MRVTIKFILGAVLLIILARVAYSQSATDRQAMYNYRQQYYDIMAARKEQAFNLNESHVNYKTTYYSNNNSNSSATSSSTPVSGYDTEEERFLHNGDIGSHHHDLTINYTNGNSYRGDVEKDWINNKFVLVKDGYGTYTWANGDYYTGKWIEGKKTGQGKMYWHGGYQYDGDWKDEQMNGHGVYTYPDSTHYSGYFIDGMRSGFGVYYFHDRSRYEGDWANDEMNGKGRIINAMDDDILAEGTWVGGKLMTGHYTTFYENGKTDREVNLKDGYYDGEISRYYPNGQLWFKEIYKDTLKWEIIEDNFADGKSTGSYLKDGNGVVFLQSDDDGKVIAKCFYEKGIEVRRETY